MNRDLADAMRQDVKLEPEQFVVGEPVIKVGGDYLFFGVVVASFTKVSGKRRYVVENMAGILHIFSGPQLRSMLSRGVDPDTSSPR